MVRQGGKRVVNDLDQVHLPDPVSQEMVRLASQISNLEAQVQELKRLLEEQASK